MKKFRYFILVLAGVAAVMLGGCKDKEKYDESAFQDDLEPLSEDEVEAMDQNGDDEMAVADESDLEQMQRLPGVGRKSANLIMGDVFGCSRLAERKETG